MTWLTNRFWQHPPRYCEQHKAMAPVAGGEYRKTDPNHQVWVCKQCIERAKNAEHRTP